MADWLPTLAELPGVPPAGQPLDGVSQLKALRGGNASRSELFYGYTDTAAGAKGGPAVRVGHWKLIRGWGGAQGVWPRPGQPANSSGNSSRNSSAYMLFDLSADPEERHDLAADLPQVVAELTEHLAAYERTAVPQATDDPRCPASRFDYDPRFGPVWAPWCAGASEVLVFA